MGSGLQLASFWGWTWTCIMQYYPWKSFQIRVLTFFDQLFFFITMIIFSIWGCQFQTVSVLLLPLIAQLAQ